jgi:hypothetical protein
MTGSELPRFAGIEQPAFMAQLSAADTVFPVAARARAVNYREPACDAFDARSGEPH